MISKAQITISLLVILGTFGSLNGYPKAEKNLKLDSFKNVYDKVPPADPNVPKEIVSIANTDVIPSGPVLEQKQGENSEDSHRRRREVPVSAYGRFDPEDSTGSAETTTIEEDVKNISTTESTTSRITTTTKHTSVTDSEKKTQKPEKQNLTTAKPESSATPESTSVTSTTKKLFQFEIPKIIPQAPPLNFGFGIGR